MLVTISRRIGKASSGIIITTAKCYAIDLRFCFLFYIYIHFQAQAVTLHKIAIMQTAQTQHKKCKSEIKKTLRLFDNEVLWIWLIRPLFRSLSFSLSTFATHIEFT